VGPFGAPYGPPILQPRPAHAAKRPYRLTAILNGGHPRLQAGTRPPLARATFTVSEDQKIVLLTAISSSIRTRLSRNRRLPLPAYPLPAWASGAGWQPSVG
jgi:hypothetical protein